MSVSVEAVPLGTRFLLAQAPEEALRKELRGEEHNAAVPCVSCVGAATGRVRLLCHPADCSLPGSSVHGILQARILEWVAISFSPSERGGWLGGSFASLESKTPYWALGVDSLLGLRLF